MAWLTGWDHRKEFVADIPSGSATNIQVKIVIAKESGESGVDESCEGKCFDDFRDLMFTNSTGDTLLDYWIEETHDGTYGKIATIWVELDFVEALGTSFYMYYEKGTVTTSPSSGANTFLFFYGASAGEGLPFAGDIEDILISGGILTLYAGTHKLYSPAYPYGDIALRTRCKIGNGDSAGVGLLARFAPLENVLALHDEASPDHTVWRSSKAGGSITDFSNQAITFGSFQVIDIVRIIDSSTDQAHGFIDGTEAGTGSVTNIPTANLSAYIVSGAAAAVEIDWILIRKTVYGEALVGAWGSEEQAPITRAFLPALLKVTAELFTVERVSRIMAGIGVSSVQKPKATITAISPSSTVGEATKPTAQISGS